MSGDMVGVDPVQVDRLASRLEELRDALHAGDAPIRRALDYAPGADAGALAQARSQADVDARNMRARARLAAHLARSERGLTFGGQRPPAGIAAPHANVVQIPWDDKDVSAELGKLDTRRLHKALHADGGIEKKELRALANDLREHTGDKHFLKAFWAGAGPDAARLARLLHDQHADADSGTTTGDVFTTEDKQTLTAFAASLAAAGKHKVLPDDIDDTLAHSGDLWSASMLLKFGPNGASYGTANGADMLAEMTRSALDHKEPFNIPVPRNVADAESARTAEQDLAEYDPRSVVLGRAAQNAAAARRTLSGDHGQDYAHILLTANWKTPGYLRSGTGFLVPSDQDGRDPADRFFDRVDIPSHAPEFLKAATDSPNDGSDAAWHSAQALAKIARAVPNFNGSSGQHLSPEIRAALSEILNSHIAGFAASARLSANGKPTEQDGVWLPVFGKSDLKNFLSQALADPVSYGSFRGRLATRVALASYLGAKTGRPSYLQGIGALYHDAQSVQNMNDLTSAEQKDALAAERQMIISTVTSAAGAVPGVGALPKAGQEAVDWAKAINAATAPSFVAFVPGGNTIQALEDSRGSFHELKEDAQIPVVQGLIRANKIDPPKHADWYNSTTGMVTPTGDFRTWCGRHSGDEIDGVVLSEWVSFFTGAVQ